MLKKLSKIYLVAAAASFPLFSYALLDNTRGIFEGILGIVKLLIPIAYGLAFLFFFWGIAKYIWSSGEAKDEGKRILFWGVIAIFVMTAIWGIVHFIGGELGIDVDATQSGGSRGQITEPIGIDPGGEID